MLEFTGRRKVENNINMTPLIDVVFLLLIFFLLTSTMLVQEAIEVNLPESSSGAEADPLTLTVVISNDGSRFLNDKEISLEELELSLGYIFAASPSESITIKSDSAVNVQDLIDTMDAIKAAGGSNISLATEGK